MEKLPRRVSTQSLPNLTRLPGASEHGVRERRRGKGARGLSGPRARSRGAPTSPFLAHRALESRGEGRPVAEWGARHQGPERARPGGPPRGKFGVIAREARGDVNKARLI